jgi:hypothetical protein
MNSNELAHFGILGMKWGVRKDRKNVTNYSKQQRIRDKKIYSKGAVKRINKRMLDGESIQSARHNEVNRKARISTGKTIAKQVAKGALVTAGAAAVVTLLNKKGLGNSPASGVILETSISVGRQVINAMFR